MSSLLERFLRYVQIDTTSIEGADTIPSFEGERDLANLLKKELNELGIDTAEVTDRCFVFASIPATPGHEKDHVVGLLAHLDTAPDCIGKDVKPQIHHNYDGSILHINPEVVIDPEQYPEIKQYIGDDIVTSSGDTLLGADDKSGIAIIMNAVETLMRHRDLPHGPIRIAFTPDEEVSVGGASIFDVDKFGADFGITVDGDGIGELNYETFHAYSYTVKIEGNNIHPAEAKGKMINAITLGMEFDALLPQDVRPEYTAGREGFIHMWKFSGDVENTTLEYILRDFDRDGIEQQKKWFQDAAQQLNDKYGKTRVTLVGEHEYSNPKELVEQKGCLLDTCAKAFQQCGIEPNIIPVRGGTDGSTLAEKGLACVNLFMGGHNYHSCREYVSVQAMEKSSEILLRLLTFLAEHQ